MNRKVWTLIILMCVGIASADAQFGKRVAKWCAGNHVADNLDVALTVGTGGLGLELATPVTRWTRLRAGVEWVPSFHIPMNFDITTFGSDGLPSDNFGEVQQMVYKLTGLEMDNTVRMISKPTLTNFKLLVDVFPFQNNLHWHFTAGFYVGGDVAGKTINDRNEQPTLVGLNVYNRCYQYFTNLTDGEVFDVYLGGGTYLDPEKVRELQEKFRHYGRIGIHIGDFKNGEPYYMEPDSDGTVSAKAFVNRFKPYIGFGYSGALDARKRWNVGVEAGAMFWGGAPDIVTHDGVNMTKDLTNIRGRVGDYMKLIKALPVYPIVNFKISYTFF